MTEQAAVTDDLGDPVGVGAGPQRLVSLVPNISELLWDWGFADQLVGVTEWCVAPPDGFPDAQRVRGTKNPDVAAIVALAPDLVIANEEENRARDVERLRAAGVPVHVTRVRSLAALPGSLGRLAVALGAPSAATPLVAAIEQARSALSPPTGRRRVACAVWRDAPQDAGPDEGWWVLGRDTYAADLLATVGVEVVPPEPDGRYPRCTFAALTALAPEVVLLPDEPYAFGPDDVRDLEHAGIEARLVDGMALWWWGPRTPEAIAELAPLAVR
ncbi:MAG: helical backbone metal receptor [Nitriliruptoraceae bacterium]